MRDRKWVTSKIASFGGNIAFVLFDCATAPAQRVMALHMERPIQIPGCNRLDCDWAQFQDVFQVTNISCTFATLALNIYHYFRMTLHVILIPFVKIRSFVYNFV